MVAWHDVRLFGSWLRFRMVVSLIGYATFETGKGHERVLGR
jgi:hypothetical protein